MQIPSEYDSPWKEALERFFPQCLEFFFPTIHEQIDWTQGWEFLDKEFQQIMRDAEVGRRLVDKLVKVWRLDGQETWVLIHLEIQGQVESEFSERMFTYFYRIRDRYRQSVVSLGILTDETPSWRPSEYILELWGCSNRFEFPIVKLLDYRSQWESLEESSNPFAVVVMAHLQAQSTRKDPSSRLEWKLKLVKGLYERGYSREEILELFRFIDWVMALPVELEDRFDEELSAFEEERKMQYVTSIERRAKRAAVLEVLEIRFSPIPNEMIDQINQINDADFLSFLHRTAVVAESLEAFQQVLIQPNRDPA
jgi:hypothetical protein